MDDGRKKEIGKLIKYYRTGLYNITKDKIYIQKNFIFEKNLQISSRKTLINIENGIQSRCDDYYFRYAEKIDKNIIFSRKIDKIFNICIEQISENLNGLDNKEDIQSQYMKINNSMDYNDILYYDELKLVIDILYNKILYNKILNITEYTLLCNLKNIFENKILILILLLISEFELYYNIKSSLNNIELINLLELMDNPIAYMTVINHYLASNNICRAKQLALKLKNENINHYKINEYLKMVQLFLNINKSYKLKNVNKLIDGSRNSFANLCSIQYYTVHLILEHDFEECINILERILMSQKGLMSLPTIVYLLIALNMQDTKNYKKIHNYIKQSKNLLNKKFVLFNLIINYFDMIYVDKCINEKNRGEYILLNIKNIVYEKNYFMDFFKDEMMDLVSKSKNYKQLFEYEMILDKL